MQLLMSRINHGTDYEAGVCNVQADAPFALFTIEQPWAQNLKGASCVPPGTYDLIPYLSPKHGPTWCLHNPDLGVWGLTSDPPPGDRNYCELHSANWAQQLQGCIAFGLEGAPMYDPMVGHIEPAVEHSVDAIKKLHEALGEMSAGHTLTITYN